MKSQNEQLTRRTFLKEATQAGATVAVSAGMASAAAPLLARAGEAGRPRASTDFVLLQRRDPCQ